MNLKFIGYWGGKSALIFVALISKVSFCDQSITLFGTAKTEDGMLIKGGTLIFIEQRGKPFSMPDAVIRTVTVTDKDGKFEVTLESVEGDMNVSLVRDLCLWKQESRLISSEKLKSGHSINADLIAKPDKCEGPNMGRP